MQNFFSACTDQAFSGDEGCKHKGDNKVCNTDNGECVGELI